MKKKRIQQLDKNLKPDDVKEKDSLRWRSARSKRFKLRGLGWPEENGNGYGRLPLRAESIVRPPVWTLAQCPAGAHLAFRSDTTDLAVRVVNQDVYVMPHMPGTGSNGLQLYCGEPFRMRPWGVAVPDQESPQFERPLLQGVPPRMREFRLYLPLYKALTSLDIALSAGARILKPSAPSVSKPVVFYGTSITQGGCAATAGTDYVCFVGRALNLETINLGFSGNGRGEPEMAEFVSEIDASLYVVDYVANSNPKDLPRTLPRFLNIVREKRPDTPILLVTNLCYSRYDYQPASRPGFESMRDTVIAQYVRRRRGGDANVYLVDGFSLLPFGIDGAHVDGAHPTTHGFKTIADRLSPFIDQILMRYA